jgi:hypothetical protein
VKSLEGVKIGGRAAEAEAWQMLINNSVDQKMTIWINTKNLLDDKGSAPFFGPELDRGDGISGHGLAAFVCSGKMAGIGPGRIRLQRLWCPWLLAPTDDPG